MLISYNLHVSKKKKKILLENISLQRNSLKSSYIFLLNLNFKKLIIELHVFIIFFILIKFLRKKNIKILSNNNKHSI